MLQNDKFRGIHESIDAERAYAVVGGTSVGHYQVEHQYLYNQGGCRGPGAGGGWGPPNESLGKQGSHGRVTSELGQLPHPRLAEKEGRGRRLIDACLCICPLNQNVVWQAAWAGGAGTQARWKLLALLSVHSAFICN